MQKSQITVPLVLSSTHISTLRTYGAFFPYTTVVDNAIGTISNCRTNIKWKNIDLRDLLGQLYDDYEYFTIEVVQIMTIFLEFAQNAMQNSTQKQYKNLNVYLSGLDFVNSTFSQAAQCQKSYAHIDNLSTLLSLANNTVVSTTFHPATTYLSSINDDYKTSKLLFHKTRQYVDLTIWFTALNETTDIPSTAFTFDYNTFPQITFKFNIKPVVK